MAQIGNKNFNNIAGAGETPIYQRTGGGTGGGNEVAEAGDVPSAYYPERYNTGGTPVFDPANDKVMATNEYNIWKKLIEYRCVVGGTYRVFWEMWGVSNYVYHGQSALYLNEQLTHSDNIISGAVNNPTALTGKTVDLEVEAGDYIAIYGNHNHYEVFADYSTGFPTRGEWFCNVNKVKISNSKELLSPPRLVYHRFSRGFTEIKDGSNYSGGNILPNINNWFRNP
jgi:hypothetical protein